MANSTCAKNSSPKGKKIYNFEEARKIVRSHGFSSQQEFLDYDCPGSYHVPKNADQLYADNGWQGWDDFLGIPWTFDDAKDIARKQNFKGKDDYLRYFEESKRNSSETSRLPYRPDLYYKDDGWKDWEDFLGV